MQHSQALGGIILLVSICLAAHCQGYHITIAAIKGLVRGVLRLGAVPKSKSSAPAQAIECRMRLARSQKLEAWVSTGNVSAVTPCKFAEVTPRVFLTRQIVHVGALQAKSGPKFQQGALCSKARVLAQNQPEKASIFGKAILHHPHTL